MNESTIEQVEPRAEIISALRELSMAGKGVPEFAADVRAQLQLKDAGTIAVMWYLMKAFSLRVADVLPIQAWTFGAQTDDEINSWILPRINTTRAKWLPSSNGSATSGVSEGFPEGHDLSIAK
jgi:hypothetical protein